MSAIEVSHLSKSYGSVKSVDNVSFRIEKGEIFGMLGPNGAGKTTTIECMTGLRDFDSGEVGVLGIRPAKDRKELYNRIGVQLQETAYQDKIRVREVCAMFSSLYDKPLAYRELLKKFDLYEKRNSYVGSLSGGQKQKLSVILALLPDPEVIFLDELTTGLDPMARRSMWECIKSLKEEGRTVFMTTHYMEEAEYLCDRVCIINKGRIAVMDSVPNVIRLSGAGYRITFQSQQNILQDLPNVLPKSARIEKEGANYSIACPEDVFLGRLTSWLESARVRYSSLNIHSPNLEDAFLKLTGMRMGDEV